MPRPRSMTTEDIAAAALAVIDRGGPDALSIRAVASELGTGTMSLYRYFDSREQLERAVVELIFGALDADTSSAAVWTDRVTVLLERFRAVAAAHPSVIPLVLAHRFTSTRAMPWAEALLAALADAGYDGEERFTVFRLLSNYAVGAIQTEHVGLVPQTDGGLVAAEQDPERFPLLAQNAPYARRVRPDKEFTAGLRRILRGLETGGDREP